MDSSQHLIKEPRQHAHYPCVECHGIDGNPPITDQYDKQSPNLAGQNAEYLERQLLSFKSGLRYTAEMDGVLQDYSAIEINQMAQYFATQSLVIVVNLDPTIDTLIHSRGEDIAWAASGKMLYQQGDAKKGIEACQSCHGSYGEGLEKTSYPTLTAQHARYIRMTLTAYRQGDRTTDSAIGSPMQTISERLSDTDIRNLAAYIQRLRLPQSGSAREE